MQYTGKNIHDIYRIFKGREIKFNVEDGWNDNLILIIKDRNANYYLTVGKYIIFSYYVDQDIPIEAREGDYIIFADNSWTIVKKENFDNEYVITEDIAELTDIHKHMEDFKFLGTKSTEITIQFKDK